MIEYLMGEVLGLRGVNAAGKENHWHLILPGVGDDVDGIDYARPNGRQQDARCSRRVVRSLGHEPAVVLMLNQLKG